MSARQHAISVVLAAVTAFIVVELTSEDSDAASPRKPKAEGVTAKSVPTHRGRLPYLPPRRHAPAEPEDAVVDDAKHPAEPIAAEVRPDPEEADALEAELHASLLEESREEARDPSWAGPMEASLSRAIEALEESTGAALEAVQCRAQTCEATVRFEGYAEARAGGPTLVSGIVNRECSKRLTLSGDHDAAPYDATLYFDCAAT